MKKIIRCLQNKHWGTNPLAIPLELRNRKKYSLFLGHLLPFPYPITTSTTAHPLREPGTDNSINYVTRMYIPGRYFIYDNKGAEPPLQYTLQYTLSFFYQLSEEKRVKGEKKNIFITILKKSRKINAIKNVL